MKFILATVMMGLSHSNWMHRDIHHILAIRRMKMITRYYYIAFYIVLMLGILIGVFAQRVMQ